MKNLAGNEKADETIQEELYLAGIPVISCIQSRGEVPYTLVGRIGPWLLRRAWYYWVAEVPDRKMGLPLQKAMELHNKKHPVLGCILGKVIRSGGHCGCPSPDVYGAEPIYDEDLDNQLEALGYKKKYCDFLKRDFVDITVGEISKICNEGKLSSERYVTCYHIDDLVGLAEFAKFIGQDLAPPAQEAQSNIRIQE